MTGHLLGGAGGLEAGISVLALRDQNLPPTINYENPDPACDLDYIPNYARKAVVRHAHCQIVSDSAERMRRWFPALGCGLVNESDLQQTFPITRVENIS